MKNKSLICLFLSIAALSSCEQKTTITEEGILNEYVGKFEIVLMDWTTNNEDCLAFDLNNDGQYTNDVISEIRNLPGMIHEPISRFVITRKGKGRFLFKLPVVDYYLDSGDHTTLLPTTYVNQVEVPLDIIIKDDQTLESNVFSHFDWADNDRIGIKSVSDIKITGARHDRIDIEVGHYLIYDNLTQKLIDGSVKIWLSRM